MVVGDRVGAGLRAVVTSARGGKRKALSLTADESVLDSAVAVICSHGPDALNVSEVAVAEALTASHESSVAYISQQEPRLRALAEAVRSVVMGLQLLEEAVGGVADVDFARGIAPLLAVARGQ